MSSSKPKTKPVNRPSVKHTSHNHPLRVYKPKETDETVCSGCELELTGPQQQQQAFKCIKSNCDYTLHKSCFDLPNQISHKSHQNHPLTLLYSPPYDQSIYTCDACGQYGSAFTYNCSICQYDVHVGCINLPEIINREDHEHTLTLLYSAPGKRVPGAEDVVFTCGICEETILENNWVYYCGKCDFGTHVSSCEVYEDEEEDEEDEEDSDEGGGRSSEASRLKEVMKARDEIAAMKLQGRIRNATNQAALDLWDEPKRKYYW